MLKRGVTVGIWICTGLALAVTLTACSTAGLGYTTASGASATQDKTVGEYSIAKQAPKDVLHVGNTQRVDVEKIYGEPRQGFVGATKDGFIAASYVYITGKSNFANGVPLYNLFKGESSGDMRILSLAYDKNNVLVWYRYKLSESNSKGIDRGCLKILDLQTDGVEPDSLKKADEEIASKQKSLPECSGTTTASAPNDSATAKE